MVLKTCLISTGDHGIHLDDAHDIFINMQRNGPTPNMRTKNIMISIYSKANRVMKAKRLWEQISKPLMSYSDGKHHIYCALVLLF